MELGAVICQVRSEAGVSYPTIVHFGWRDWALWSKTMRTASDLWVATVVASSQVYRSQSRFSARNSLRMTLWSPGSAA